MTFRFRESVPRLCPGDNPTYAGNHIYKEGRASLISPSVFPPFSLEVKPSAAAGPAASRVSDGFMTLMLIELPTTLLDLIDLVIGLATRGVYTQHGLSNRGAKVGCRQGR
jgi:hypothetical protein